jgi:hypothetical protein
MADLIAARFVFASELLDRMTYLPYTGMATDAKMPRIATATISSMSVKPASLRVRDTELSIPLKAETHHEEKLVAPFRKNVRIVAFLLLGVC